MTFDNPIDDYLWGGGYYEQGRTFYPDLPKPIQERVECAKCGELVPPEEHSAYDGFAYHRGCLPCEGVVHG